MFVLCSHSPGARDPDLNRGSLLPTHYQNPHERLWLPMPDASLMKVTNPFRRKGRASAFKVHSVTVLPQPIVPPFGIEWYAKGERRWRSDNLPTRGEFLIRRSGDGSCNARRVTAVLELEPPFLATVKREPDIVSTNEP